MSCPLTRSAWKSLSILAVSVLTLGLWAGLMMATPAVAQTPDDAPSDLQPDSVSSMPAGHIPPPGSTGLLHVHVYDQITGRPLDSRQISVYDRSGERVGQVVTSCGGSVEFDSLPSGPYRIILEPNPNWITGRRYHSPGGRNTPGEWVWVRPYWPVGVRFYELPNVIGAGLRVYAFHFSSRQANRPREPLAGAAFTVYGPNDNFVANGVTGCGGFVDFNDLPPGSYRVVDANEADGVNVFPPSGEQWVSVQFGTLTSTWFFTVPSPGPRTTPTPEP